MKREDVKIILDEILDDKLGLSDEINEDFKLYDDLGADSLDAVEIVMECEKKFDISIEDSEYSDATTVKDLLDIVCGKIDAK